MVQVSHESQAANGSFVIVENANNQLPLLGRDWLYCSEYTSMMIREYLP